MKFKVGQKVRVRGDLEIGKQYGRCFFVYGMAPFRGSTITIENIVEGYGYHYCGWNFSPEMLAPIVGRWKPKVEEKYWYITVSGSEGWMKWDNDRIDKRYFAYGNCFRTRKLARAAGERARQVFYRYDATVKGQAKAKKQNIPRHSARNGRTMGRKPCLTP